MNSRIVLMCFLALLVGACSAVSSVKDFIKHEIAVGTSGGGAPCRLGAAQGPCDSASGADGD